MQNCLLLYMSVMLRPHHVHWNEHTIAVVSLHHVEKCCNIGREVLTTDESHGESLRKEMWWAYFLIVKTMTKVSLLKLECDSIIETMVQFPVPSFLSPFTCNIFCAIVHFVVLLLPFLYVLHVFCVNVPYAP